MFKADDVVFLDGDTKVRLVTKVEGEIVYLKDGDETGYHQDRIKSLGDMTDGDGKIGFQFTLPTAGLTEEEAMAKAEGFKEQVMEIIAAAGLDPDSITIGEVEYRDDGV